MSSVTQQRVVFRGLHESGCFVIPNPWDVGSAKYLEHLRFKALATTSAGFAFARGLPDGGVGRDAMLAHVRDIVGGVDLPVNADFENGYADDPAEVAENVRLCIATGVAGLSIEDSTGQKERPLYELSHAVERISAAREVTAVSNVVLVARAECFLVGLPSLDEVIRRLTAYASAGADCLYAPDLQTAEQIKAVVEAVAPKPLNVLISSPTLGLTVDDVAALGVRRISVGGALARAAWGGFIAAAKGLATSGTFTGFSSAAPHRELQALFGR